MSLADATEPADAADAAGLLAAAAAAAAAAVGSAAPFLARLALESVGRLPDLASRRRRLPELASQRHISHPVFTKLVVARPAAAGLRRRLAALLVMPLLL